jgi:hypothetical protein
MKYLLMMVRSDEEWESLTDGPFIESKETIAGYGLVNVDKLDTAIEIAQSWPPRGHKVEIRPMVEH